MEDMELSDWVVNIAGGVVLFWIAIWAFWRRKRLKQDADIAGKPAVVISVATVSTTLLVYLISRPNAAGEDIPSLVALVPLLLGIILLYFVLQKRKTQLEELASLENDEQD